MIAIGNWHQERQRIRKIYVRSLTSLSLMGICTPTEQCHISTYECNWYQACTVHGRHLVMSHVIMWHRQTSWDMVQLGEWHGEFAFDFTQVGRCHGIWFGSFQCDRHGTILCRRTDHISEDFMWFPQCTVDVTWCQCEKNLSPGTDR